MSPVEPQPPSAEPDGRQRSAVGASGAGGLPDRLPWLLRAPVRDQELTPATREQDRAAALDARRTSLVVLPVVAVLWLVAVLAGGETGARIGTLVALILSVFVGVRAAVTTQRFRRRWVDPADLAAPPGWVTLLTVGSVVGAIVAGMNVAADIRADRSAVASLVLATVFAAVVGVGSYAHLAGGRSVGAALRAPAGSDEG